MKHKMIVSLLIVIGIVFVVTLVHVTEEQQAEEIVEVSAEEVVEKEPVVWQANYIWNGTTEKDQWMCFRKTVDLTKEEIKNARAQIAVDSKYWLYINGKMVIREGGLKRGETMHSTYYDDIDLTNDLQEGKNTIAILVWYWGNEGYSHNTSGQGALLFQAKMGDTVLISDETWKVSPNPAYLHDTVRPNRRLNETNVYYDASLANENWYQPDFDDVSWANATILNSAGSEPWGELIERNIPQFKDFGLKEYENMADYANDTTTQTRILGMKIPYNAQFTPYLKVEAKAGIKITITTDFYEDLNGDSVRCTYLTKAGEQEFESPAWMNGETVYYEIPAGVKIISLGYRETGYDTEMTGKFECNDEFFNKLWQMADRTLYVNMRDSYMDCPNRERAAWFGDASIEMLEAMYALDTNAYDLFEKAVKTTIGWKQDDHILLTVVPNRADLFHLPVQMLLGINSIYEYYEYTGKTEILEMSYEPIKNYLNLWYVQEDGLVHSSVTYPIWEWADSSGNVDYEATENAWYYLAMSRASQMAQVLGYAADVADFQFRLENLKNHFNALWTDNGYRTAKSDCVDERANAVAVIAGLADSEKYETITQILTNSFHATTFMEKYVLEALCQMGKIEEAQERIKNRYEEMVDGKQSCSTLWENWNAETGTKNHAWAGGPLIMMSKYFAGIEPLEKGYEVISIKPRFGKLTNMSSDVTTIKGDVHFEAEKSEKALKLKVNVPAKAKIAIEKMSNNPQISVDENVIYEDGENKKQKGIEYDSEDEKYLYFYIENGEYEFTSR